MKIHRFLAIGLVFALAFSALAAGTATGADMPFRIESRKIMDAGLKLDVRYPRMAGCPDRAAQDGFNALVRTRLDSQVAEYRRQALDNAREIAASGQDVPGRSSFLMRFENRYARRNLVSVTFLTEVYYAGAAHPSHLVTSLTYDVAARRPVELADLFVRNSDYLGVIAGHCIAEIARRRANTGFEPFEGENAAGAEPKPENYTVFAVTRPGLLVVFNEYQVGCYAEGIYEITVPWKKLKDLIDPKGPAADFAR